MIKNFLAKDYDFKNNDKLNRKVIYQKIEFIIKSHSSEFKTAEYA